MTLQQPAVTVSRAWLDWRLYVPKSFTVLIQEGYRLADFRADAVAGLTVAIVALPLAMAIAIASGTTPDKGLITAVIAGFLISALGGSRFQIGGPTGAFIVVVYGVIAKFGFDGLIVAALMAGAMLIIAGILRFGDWIKYVPEPVVTGFTAGIAVIIFTSQIKDLLGLTTGDVPADFIPKIETFWAARETIALPAVGVAIAALVAIILLRRIAPKVPGFLVAVAGGALIAWLLKLPVETIGSKFGGVPATLPSPALPSFTPQRLQELLPSAFTIAFLAGVESLLSAMVADGMTGRRHRSNCELVAQGAANIVSALFGGLCATGAIARTATNIRSGGRTPVAGMLHAVFLLIFMLSLGPLLSFIPLATLAAVLAIVAWNMSEQERFRQLLGGPMGDRIVLLATFGLTVIVDLTVAIEVGIVLSALIFMHRMAEAAAFEKGVALDDHDQVDLGETGRAPYAARRELPNGVEVFVLHGPLFFGAASRLNDAFEAAFPPPKAFILRFANVPMVDTSGVGTLIRFLKRCESHGVAIVLAELQPRSREVLTRMGVLNFIHVSVTSTYASALAIASDKAGVTDMRAIA
jgi:SulP family sulfate permease